MSDFFEEPLDEDVENTQDDGMLEFSFEITDPELIQKLITKDKQNEDEIETTSKTESNYVKDYSGVKFTTIEPKNLRLCLVPKFFVEGKKSKLTANQVMLLCYLFAAMANYEDENLRYFAFPLSDFADVFENTESSMLVNFQRCKTAFREFKFSEDFIHDTPVFEAVFTYKNNLMVVMDKEFNTKFVRGVNIVEKPSYGNLKQLQKLRNYEVWLYFMLVRFINTGVRYVDHSREEYEFRVGLAENKTPNFNVFEKKIKEACENISKSTNIKTGYEFSFYSSLRRNKSKKLRCIAFKVARKNTKYAVANLTDYIAEHSQEIDYANRLFADWDTV